MRTLIERLKRGQEFTYCGDLYVVDHIKRLGNGLIRIFTDDGRWLDEPQGHSIRINRRKHEL